MPGFSHNQNMIAGLDLVLFVPVCNSLNLYQCGNVVGAPANTNRSKAPLQTQSNQLNEFVIPTPWLAVLSMPRKNLGDALRVSNWFLIEFAFMTSNANTPIKPNHQNHTVRYYKPLFWNIFPRAPQGHPWRGLLMVSPNIAVRDPPPPIGKQNQLEH